MMTLTDRAEEILETLWIEIVEKKKDKCDVSILKDDEVIKQLGKKGYINMEENQIKLTDNGKEEAKSCVRRHRLAERLLVDVLDFKKKLIHKTGCKLEHILHKGLDDNICTLLGHPKTCPHGRPIPEGDCCKEAKSIPGKLIMPLSELDSNKKAKVIYLQTGNRQVLQKLIAMGVLPNKEITLVQKFPSFVFSIGKSQFAIDHELASKIFVRNI